MVVSNLLVTEDMVVTKRFWHKTSLVLKSHTTDSKSSGLYKIFISDPYVSHTHLIMPHRNVSILPLQN